MNRNEAEAIFADYRSLLKAWTIAVSGFSDGDSDAIGAKLREGEDSLAAIAIGFPEMDQSVDLLINARKRTWAGPRDERGQSASE